MEELPAAPTTERVTVVDVQMPFRSMVLLLVKLALASIPASVILFVLSVLFFFMLSICAGIMGLPFPGS